MTATNPTTTSYTKLKQANEEKQKHRYEPHIIKRISTIMVTNELLWFEDDYVTCDPLGEPGTFGMAFSCYRRDDDSKKLYAVKQINKAKFYHIERSARVEILKHMKNEIEVMRSLHHENIVQLHEVYEDRNYIYLVMDYLSGGELFKRISDNDALTEKDAAIITKQILTALSYMQSNNICHLDLKPDNIMFESDKKDAQIKLIDFGMAQVVPRLNKMQQTVGTPYYTAPEVLAGEYDRAADIWSVGVIVFCMLFGFPPFYIDQQSVTIGMKEEELIFEKIKQGFIAEVREGYGPFFPSDLPVSSEAMSFISGMLKYSVADRMTVDECLGHPWIRGKSYDKTLPKTVFDSLCNFDRTCRFKLIVSKLFSHKLDPTRYAQTLEVFKKWDKNGDGEISLQEFKIGMKQTTDLSDQEIQEIFSNLDQDDSRSITIDELIISSAYNALVSVDERLYATFAELDKDGDGTITVDELRKILSENNINDDIASDDIDSVIDEIDINGDGKIDYEEFLHALHPQYNETIVQRNQSKIKHKGFGTFDENQFNQFQSFLKQTDSKTVLQYHWNPKAMQKNFSFYRKEKNQVINKLSSLEEEEVIEVEEKVQVANKSKVNTDSEKKHVEKKNIKPSRNLIRESDNMDKYDPSRACCVML